MLRLFVKGKPKDMGAPRLSWLTWSSEARSVLGRLAEAIPGLAQPRLLSFSGTEYGYTFSWDPSGMDAGLRRSLEALAIEFYHLRTGSGLTLVDELIGQEIDGTVIRCFFSLARSVLVRETNCSDVAIYAPLGAVGGTAQGDFPLHADLYAPVILLNVFDQISLDCTGASRFLRVPTLLDLLARCGMPELELRRVRSIVTGVSNVDRYEEFYDLLHGAHTWTSTLEVQMEAHTFRIALGQGQGYLVHDRRWLHGRDNPTGKVKQDRLHRLIFDTESTLRRRRRATQGIGDGGRKV
jgi:hypothetical protein